MSASLRFFSLFHLVFLFGASVAHSDQTLELRRKKFEGAYRGVTRQVIGQDEVVRKLLKKIEGWYVDGKPNPSGRPLIISLWGAKGKSTLLQAVVKALGLDDVAFSFDADSFAGIGGHGQKTFGESLFDAYAEKEAKTGSLSPVGDLAHPVIMIDEFQALSMAQPHLLANGLWSLLKKGKLPGQRGQKDLDLSRSLIFITGSFNHLMPGSEEFDPDAYTVDQLHRMTSSINQADVIKGFRDLFRAEEIACIGRNVIFLPTLSEESFKRLIDDRLAKITEIANQADLAIGFSSRFKNYLYNEAVSPALGVGFLNDVMDQFEMEDHVASVRKKMERLHLLNKNGDLNTVVVDLVDNEPVAEWRFDDKHCSLFDVPAEHVHFRHSQDAVHSFATVRLAAFTTVYMALWHKVPLSIMLGSKGFSDLGSIQYPENFHSEADLFFHSSPLEYIALKLAAGVAEQGVLEERSRFSNSDFKMARDMAFEMVIYDNINRPGFSLGSGAESPLIAANIENGRKLAEAILERESAFFSKLLQLLNQHDQVTQLDLHQLARAFWTQAQDVERFMIPAVESSAATCARALLNRAIQYPFGIDFRRFSTASSLTAPPKRKVGFEMGQK